ncbi:hypothetical protein Q1695_000440 [Nippostrongylus brasiliensis]|nr:hypothetical protein Q1695_000440 [Nippostrongylus brasiliensis]
MKHSDDGANGEEQDYTDHSLTFESEEIFEAWLKEKCEITVTSLFKRNTRGNTYQLRCNRSGQREGRSERRAKPSKKDVIYCSCYCRAGAPSTNGGSEKLYKVTFRRAFFGLCYSPSEERLFRENVNVNVKNVDLYTRAQLRKKGKAPKNAASEADDATEPGTSKSQDA